VVKPALGETRNENDASRPVQRAGDPRPTMPPMPLGDLTQAWVTASAALPLDWILVGVWLDPDRPGWWQAEARGPGDAPEIVTGYGSHTGLALNDLANRLRERRGKAPSG
jgi:hypothetical protein